VAEARPLDVRITAGGGGPSTVTANGELDLTSVDRLRAVLLPLVVGGTAVLDAAGISFCDSAGLLAILLANRRAREQGGTLRIAAPSDALLRVIELAGALEVLSVFPDTGSALSA
jgi:anti-anti-sigma factor